MLWRCQEPKNKRAFDWKNVMALIALLGVNTAIVSLLFNAGNTHTISTILKELKVQKSVLVSVTWWIIRTFWGSFLDFLLTLVWSYWYNWCGQRLPTHGMRRAQYRFHWYTTCKVQEEVLVLANASVNGNYRRTLPYQIQSHTSRLFLTCETDPVDEPDRQFASRQNRLKNPQNCRLWICLQCPARYVTTFCKIPLQISKAFQSVVRSH